jgi:putative oxidoreductase
MGDTILVDEFSPGPFQTGVTKMDGNTQPVTSWPSKAKRVMLWIVSIVVAAMFIMAGGMKFAGLPMHVEHFQKWGYPDWFRVSIGIAKVADGVGLLIARLASFGAAGLVAIMLAAVYTHLAHDEAIQVVAPGVFLLVFGVLTYARWPRRSGVLA